MYLCDRQPLDIDNVLHEDRGHELTELSHIESAIAESDLVEPRKLCEVGDEAFNPDTKLQV